MLVYGVFQMSKEFVINLNDEVQDLLTEVPLIYPSYWDLFKDAERSFGSMGKLKLFP